MPVICGKKDTVVINPDIKPNVLVVHPSSTLPAEENLKSVLGNAKEGQIILGDFNVDFLNPKNRKILEEILAPKGLRLDVTPGSVKKAGVLMKMRSRLGVINPQRLKGGKPDVSLKDLAFKLVKREDGEPIIPEILQKKLEELSKRKQKFMKEAEPLLKKEILDVNEINTLAFSNNVVSFLSLFRSHAKDHFPSYYYDKETNTVVYAINLLKNEAHDFDNHFRDGKKVDLPRVNKLFTNLDTIVFRETYKLFAKVDGTNLKGFESLTNEQLKSAIDERLGKNATSSNGGKELTKADYVEYIHKILTSPELAKVNAELKIPYQLDNKEFIKAKLEELSSDELQKVYSKNLGKLINLWFQSLKPGIPKQEEQAISLKGTGFETHKNEDGSDVSVEDVEEIQLDSEKLDLLKIREEHPGAEISVAIIEGEGQDAKCNALNKFVGMLNNNLSAIPNNPVQKLIDNNNNTYVTAGLAFTAGGLATAIAGRALSKYSSKPQAHAEGSAPRSTQPHLPSGAQNKVGSMRPMSTMPIRAPRPMPHTSIPHNPLPKLRPTRATAPLLLLGTAAAGIGLFQQNKNRSISRPETNQRENAVQPSKP